jgi:hypothetical protein
MATPVSDLLMVDPSLLLSEEGLAWLDKDESARRSIVIPAVFAEWLSGERELEIESLVAPEDLESVSERRARLNEILGEVAAFSHHEATLSRQAQAVLQSLLDSKDPIGELRADEWAFLQSHSFIASKVRHALDAFRDAGAVIVEFGRKVGRQLIAQVIPADKLPSVLTPKLMAVATIKWIFVGGAQVGGGTLGGVVGTAIGGTPGTILGGAAGRYAGRRVGQAAVMAIDP